MKTDDKIPVQVHQALVEKSVDDLADVFARNGFDPKSTANCVVGVGIGLAVEASGIECTIADLRRAADHLENQIETLDKSSQRCVH